MEEYSYNVVEIIKLTEAAIGFHYNDEAKQQKVKAKEWIDGPVFHVMFLRLEDVAAALFNRGETAKKFGFVR
jgi:hypothetical protein